MATDFREGSLLGGRYRLERVLGTGGMAAVWLASDERLRRAAAVKILSDTLAADPTYLSRFRREARLAAGLSHPNLVRVHDFGGEDERPYLAMEYVEGGTLADRISARTARELDASRLARELLSALDHIHDAGIIHRDVKPGNVLIAPDGTAKLTDFGIAQPENATRLTSTGLVIGTHSYIAPEVGRGERATARSDLYACAVVLREAFGDPPPPELADLIARLGDPDPARRPESASRALGLLAGPSPSASAVAATATAATEPLAPERTARTIPIGGHASGQRHEARVLVGPGALAGAATLAALIVVGVLLLNGGDDGPSTGTSPAGNPAGEEVRQQQPSAEEAGSRLEEAAPSEEPTPSGKSKGKKPKRPKGSDERKEKGPSKEPPGKAKGRSED